ncbi:MAG TPA: hypothetical protein VKR52_12140 [Terracidiphilus sp.]|nr:hypothetical protein [Terracidiphilus sp.]
MKRFFGYALILGMLSIPALAAKKSESLTVATPVKVGTTQLAAGDYDLSWTGTGPTVELSIAQHGKTIVTVPAKAQETKSPIVSLSTNKVGGVDVLESIQLHKVNLVLSGSTSNGE